MKFLEFVMLYEQYILLLFIVVIIILMFVFKESKIIIDIVGNAIVEAEKELNSKSGQDRLEYATKLIQERLPKYLQFIITKRLIVSLIELMLNSMNKAFKINKSVDIKGNE